MADDQSHPDDYDIDDEETVELAPFRMTRRRALGAVGVGVATAGIPGLAAAATRRSDRSSNDRGDNNNGDRNNRDDGGRNTRDGNNNDDGPGRFSRMFDDHPTFAEPDDELKAMLAELGAPVDRSTRPTRWRSARSGSSPNRS